MTVFLMSQGCHCNRLRLYSDCVPAVPALDDHGSARVALAGVLAAVGGARAHEDPRYPLVLARAPVHRHALQITDEFMSLVLRPFRFQNNQIRNRVFTCGEASRSMAHTGTIARDGGGVVFNFCYYNGGKYHN